MPDEIQPALTPDSDWLEQEFRELERRVADRERDARRDCLCCGASQRMYLIPGGRAWLCEACGMGQQRGGT